MPPLLPAYSIGHGNIRVAWLRDVERRRRRGRGAHISMRFLAARHRVDLSILADAEAADNA